MRTTLSPDYASIAGSLAAGPRRRPQRPLGLPGQGGLTPTGPRQPQMLGGGGPRQPQVLNSGTPTPGAPPENSVLPTTPMPSFSFLPSPTTGQYNLKKQGLKKGAKKIQNSIMQTQYGLMQSAINPLLASIQGLMTDANTSQFSPEKRTAFLEPRRQAWEAGMDNARGQLGQTLGGLGLDESSDAVSRFSGLEARGADAWADNVNDLFTAEDEQQRLDQARLLDVLTGLVGGSSNSAASIAQQKQQNALLKAQMDAQQGNPFADILGGLGGIAPFLFPPGAGAGGAIGGSIGKLFG